ncbi:MAG TPA: hypothetical protein P5309_10365 [Syntrophomonadaceae bacterium]|jgi:hypothetical protein|nr:hypothetical protein [Syntrophomonadaceae bacterium]
MERGGKVVEGLIVAFAIMVSLITGMVSVIYVFQRIYLEADDLESNMACGRRGNRD